MALVPEVENCDAILQAWYPGERGGEAIADVLYGDYNPQGKLPVTFYKSLAQLPDFQDYNMKGRTYRYMTEKPLFPFGFGLSYTRFNIGVAQMEHDNRRVQLSIPVENVGRRAGTEVVQVYLRRTDDTQGPVKTLRGYARVTLKAGESRVVNINLNAQQLETFDPSTNQMRVLPGQYEIYYGTSSADTDLKCIDLTI